MSYPIGTTLKRRASRTDDEDFNEILIVGSERDSLSVQSNTTFSGVRRLTATEVRAEYDTDVLPEPGSIPIPGYTPVEQTPEEIFAAAERVNPPAVDKGRESIRKQKLAANKPAVKNVKPSPVPTPEEVVKLS